MFYYVSDDWGEIGLNRTVDGFLGGDDPEYFKAYLDYVKQTLMPLIMNTDYELSGYYSDKESREACYKDFSDWIAEIEDPNPTEPHLIEKYDTGHIGVLFEMLHLTLQLKMPEPINEDHALPLDLSNHKPTKITD